jgi:hypothetical protein
MNRKQRRAGGRPGKTSADIPAPLFVLAVRHLGPFPSTFSGMYQFWVQKHA